MDFIVEQITNQPIVCMRRTGAYGIENIKLMSELKEWAKQKGLFDDCIIYGIAQDDSSITPQDECRYDVCLVATVDLADEAVQQGEIPNGKYAVFTIAHTTEAVQEFWASVMNIIRENGLQYAPNKPILERYKQRLLEKHKCEFCVPII